MGDNNITELIHSNLTNYIEEVNNVINNITEVTHSNLTKNTEESMEPMMVGILVGSGLVGIGFVIAMYYTVSNRKQMAPKKYARF